MNIVVQRKQILGRLALVPCICAGAMVLSMPLRAQHEKNSIGLSLGATQNGFAGILSHNTFLDRTSFVQTGLFSSYSEDSFKGERIPFQMFTVQVGYYKKIRSSRYDGLILYGGAGLVGGYESVNEGRDELPSGALVTSKSGFVYGIHVGLDLDIYLSEKLSLVLIAHQYYHPNSSLGEFLAYAGLGIRYMAF